MPGLTETGRKGVCKVAAYVPVPRDLSKVKTKVLFNLTKRQLICFGGAALIGIPVFFGLKKVTGNTSLAVMGMMIIMLPLFFLAMYERDGQPLEVIAKHFVESKFIRPKIRPYQTDNYYSILMRQAQAEREVKEIVRKKQTQNTKQKKHGGHPSAGRAHQKGTETNPQDH